MLNYPNQAKRSIEVQTRFANQFEFASRLFSFWLYRHNSRWLDKCPLSPLAKQVAMMLNLQTCKQFRSIVELCEQCEAFNAGILARCLFESALGICFLLKPAAAALEADKGKKKKFVVTINPKASLSIDRRAMLYRARSIFDNAELERRIAEESGQEISPETQQMEKAVEQELGEEWAYILHHSHSYSGLSVADLAHLIGEGMENWYRKVYFQLSPMVHGADAVRHLRVDSATGLFSPAMLASDDEVSGILFMGVAMFLVAITTLHNEIDFGPATGMALDGFYGEYAKLFL